MGLFPIGLDGSGRPTDYCRKVETAGKEAIMDYEDVFDYAKISDPNPVDEEQIESLAAGDHVDTLASGEGEEAENSPEVVVSDPVEYDEEPKEEPILIIRTTTLDRSRHLDLDNPQTAELKKGPRVRKEATYWPIRSRHTGQLHHHQLTIKTFNKRKDGWLEDEAHSITLADEDGDEIKLLLEFLHMVHGGSEPKSSRDCVIRVPEGSVNAEVLHELAHHLDGPEQVKVFVDVLSRAAQNPGLLQVLLQRAARDPQLFAEAAAALNLARYESALDKLKRLIDSNAKEARFQEHLEENPWMFGSEYSERLDIRKLTRDEQQDFLLRRTTDGYVELIEIKTPLAGEKLFIHDGSHACWYPCAAVTKVISQVENYLEEIDANRYHIKAKDHIDPAKTRAKIIIGRDDGPAQQEALRRLNAYRQRIEVITFDQLVNMAECVLDYLRGALRLPVGART
jgi:Shedu protein SduA, C-terminal